MLRKNPVNYFLFGCAAAALLCGPLILDLTLVPRFLGLALFLSLMLLAFWRRTTVFEIPRHSSVFSYGVFTVLIALSVSWSTNLGAALFDTGKQLCFFLVLLSILYFLQNWPRLVSSSIYKLSVIVFYIAFVFVVFQLSGIRSLAKDQVYLISGINGHKNLFSSFLFLNLFFLVLAYRNLNTTWRRSALWAILLSLVLIALLRTKAVYLALAAVLPLCLILSYTGLRFNWLNKKPVMLSLVLTFVLGGNLFFGMVLPQLIPKSAAVMKEADNSSLAALKLEEERLVLWEKTYVLVHQRPALGCGAGNWQVHMPDATLSGLWRGEDLNYTFQRPHNDWLWILSENGWIGFNLFLLTVVLLLLSLMKALPADNKALRSNVSLSIAAITGYLIISFFDFPRERVEHGVWFSLIFGFSLHFLGRIPAKSIRVKRPVLLLLLFVFITITYTALLRYKGEYYTRKMLNYKMANQPAKVIKAGHTAMSFAYSLDPTSVPLYWYTGNAEVLLGNPQKAQVDFLKALRLNPYNRNVLNDLASAYVYNNDVIQAKYYYEEAARISPRFDDPKLNLAALYINAGDYKTADTWLKSILHDSPRRDSYQKIVDQALLEK